MKKLIFIWTLLILLSNVSYAANLGVYETGDTITYSVVCLTDEGAKDTGCAAPDDDILDPDDTTAKSPTSALAEVSDANFPGLWRGSYLIPAAPLKGTWSIFIELTNSNSTTAATVLNFQVLTDYFATQDDLTSGIVVLTSATETQINNIETDTNDLQTNQGNWVTATGFSTLTTSDNIGINWADVSNPSTTVDLSNTIIKTVDTCSALTTNNDKTNYGLTSATETQINNIETDTNDLQTNQGNWITATGFSTHSAANVWSVGTRELTSLGTLVDDIWDESQSGHTTPGTFGYYLDDKVSDASGASAQEVWEYDISGMAVDSAGWVLTTIKTIVEWIEQLL